MLGILDGLAPEQPQSMALAARELDGAIHRLPSPRSLAEIRFGSADVGLLNEWGSRLTRASAAWSNDTRSVSGSSFTRQQTFGLLFLALACETARREATEGQVWASVRRRLSAEARSQLFLHGQPRQATKDAIESACHYWRLRHVFGQEGTQAWYTSIYLQFGFTQRTIASRLPARLARAETLPTAVSHLLTDSRQASSSFNELWNALLRLRRRNQSADRASKFLAQSPWVLPEWVPELLQAAVARLELDQAVREDSGFEPSVFAVPRLEWTDGPPQFEVELVNLAEVLGDLESGSYRVTADETALAEFTIDSLGTPHGLRPLRLPPSPPRITASIERHEAGDDWSVVASEELALWDPDDEVAAFSEDGLALDAWTHSLSPERGYWLLLSSGLELNPPAKRFTKVDDYLLAHLEPNWPNELCVVLDGEEIWTPNVDARKRSVPLSGISLPESGTPLGESPELHLYGPRSKIVSARVDRLPVDFSQTSTGISLTIPQQREIRPSALVRLRDDERITYAGRVSINWIGAQHLRPNGWQSFPADEIDERDVGRRIRVFGPNWEAPTLFLGSQAIGTVSRWGRAVSLDNAWGDRLTVADGHFNQAPHRTLRLTDSVTSNGVIQNVDGEEPFYLILRRPVDHEEAMVFGIDRNGELEPLEPYPTGERSWLFESLPENGIAITVAGELIGSWWMRPLSLPESSEEALRRAQLLRLCGAPLLSPGFRGPAFNLATTHPSVALGWLLDLRLDSDSPVSGTATDNFSPTGRELLDRWRPDALCLRYFAATLQEGTSQVMRGVATLATSYPVQVARLLSAATSASLLPKQIRSRILEELGWNGRFEIGTLTNISNQFRVDERFLQRLADDALKREQGESLEGIQSKNLLVAMNLSGDFRRYLAGRMLEER